MPTRICHAARRGGLALGFGLSMTVAVDAGPRHRGNYGAPPQHPGYVVADSSFGHGTVSGPIRQGPRNLEVRLPRGTWVDCGRSCSDTLRRQTVDFWENVGKDGADQGRGYLSRSWGF